MEQILQPFIAVIGVSTIILFLIAAIIWLIGGHGIDKILHPAEWHNSGKAGERIVHNALIKQLHLPEKYILKNVYIPTQSGNTAEIDLIAISPKGILVFECKNYAGNIYGDASKQKWIQFLGKKRSYFYNPFRQNRGHVKHLRDFLSQYDNVPIIPFVATITRGKWHVKNFGPEDYLLGYNCHLKDVLQNYQESSTIQQNLDAILAKLTPLSRPDRQVQEKHIAQLQQKHKRTP